MVLFDGTARNYSAGKSGIIALEYQAQETMAEKVIHGIVQDVCSRYPVLKVAVQHRLGKVSLMEPSVLIGVSCAHRAEAYAASREIIDRIKHEAPIWKREHFRDGTTEWVQGCSACSPAQDSDVEAQVPSAKRLSPEQRILEECQEGIRLSSEKALRLLQWNDWNRIIAAGKACRDRLHQPGEVSYTTFRVINYTNFCNVDCTFCSFMDEVESQRGYTLTLDEIVSKTEAALELGADQVFIQGGVNPKLSLSYYTEILSHLQKHYSIHIRGFSPVELLRLAQKEDLPLAELLRILKEAGLNSVPGAGAEILTERMRHILSPKKLSAEEWCTVMGECHKQGMPGSANIVFGSVETDQDIIEHLQFVREQQDKTGGFLSFIPWIFQPQTKKFQVKHVKSWEYLRMVALCRLFFDNIANIEASVLVMGKELSELALQAGANDINSIVIEENVLRSHGLKTIRAAERFIRNAGFEPRRRTLNYEFEPYDENNQRRESLVAS